jgi:DNA-binding MarR family transcriptional regulator
MSAARQHLLAAVGNATQAYQRSTHALDDAVADALGLNQTDLRCLDWLYDGPKSAGQLAHATGLSTAATTTLLDRLETRGLLRRVRDTADRRKVLVEMTEHGQQETGRFYGPLAAEGAALLDRFSDDELGRVLDFLRAATELTDQHRARIRERVAAMAARTG